MGKARPCTGREDRRVTLLTSRHAPDTIPTEQPKQRVPGNLPLAWRPKHPSSHPATSPRVALGIDD
ncbi:hypothetical protein KFU94_00715 [Chloroflexi bacterium TSY]|nr:hypothetical protein [Chloroflexi bacterium TSY]